MNGLLGPAVLQALSGLVKRDMLSIEIESIRLCSAVTADDLISQRCSLVELGSAPLTARVSYEPIAPSWAIRAHLSLRAESAAPENSICNHTELLGLSLSPPWPVVSMV